MPSKESLWMKFEDVMKWNANWVSLNAAKDKPAYIYIVILFLSFIDPVVLEISSILILDFKFSFKCGRYPAFVWN